MICVNGRPSTAISVFSVLSCMLLNLLKTLFIMFKCHFIFFLIRSLISSFASNWTSACEVEIWLSVEVSSMPGLNTESLCVLKDLFHYFASRKGLLPDKAAVDSWLVLFILSLPTPLHPGCNHMKKCVPPSPDNGNKPRISASLILAAAENTRNCSEVPASTCTHPHSWLNVLFIRTCLRVGAAQEAEIFSLDGVHSRESISMEGKGKARMISNQGNNLLQL